MSQEDKGEENQVSPGCISIYLYVCENAERDREREGEKKRTEKQKVINSIQYSAIYNAVVSMSQLLQASDVLFPLESIVVFYRNG